MANEQEPADPDVRDLIDAMPDGWVKAMNVRFVRVTRAETVAELDVDPSRHHQPLGIVHGGVYSGLIETVTSVGAGVSAIAEGRMPVGLENHTSFLRSVRAGRLLATARPLVGGRRTQVWEAVVTDDRQRVVARGTVRFLLLKEGEALGGEGAAIRRA